MDAETLRALQAPLKDRYRSDAGTALVTLRAVATALGIELRGGTVRAEGDLDFRGTLGVAKEAPVEQRAALLKLTERYCVVLQTLRQPPAVEVSSHVTAGATTT